MKRNWFFLAVIIILLCVAATACQRSASKEALITPTLSSDVPFPVASQPPLMLDILAITQTAMAGGIGTADEITGEELIQETTESTLPDELDETTEPEASATPIVFPSSTPGKPETYTLQTDEHLYCIARRFNVNPSDLVSLNNLSEGTVLFPDMELKIPTAGSWEAGPRSLKEHPTQYTVLAGDTVYKIACGFGDVSPNEILDANQLANADSIKVGQVLLIP